MASDLSTYIGNKLVRWIAGNAMPTAPAFVELALFNGDPKASGVEVTDDIRVAGRIQPTWTVPAAGLSNTLVNSADADFGSAAGSATITHAAIYDDAGNLIASDVIPGQPYAVTAGQGVKFSAGQLQFLIGT